MDEPMVPVDEAPEVQECVTCGRQLPITFYRAGHGWMSTQCGRCEGKSRPLVMLAWANYYQDRGEPDVAETFVGIASRMLGGYLPPRYMPGRYWRGRETA